MVRQSSVVAACLAALALGVPGGAQEKKESVPRSASGELVEKVLADLNIHYQKTTGKVPNTYFYKFDRNNYKIQLGNHAGQFLSLTAAFAKAPLEQINAWNVRAKFSRAVLNREGERASALVETQLDCEGGVTGDVIRQFITRFDNDVKEFDRFLSR